MISFSLPVSTRPLTVKVTLAIFSAVSTALIAVLEKTETAEPPPAAKLLSPVAEAVGSSLTLSTVTANISLLVLPALSVANTVMLWLVLFSLFNRLPSATVTLPEESIANRPPASSVNE